MGADIHFYVERREAGNWVTCDTWEDEGDGCGHSVPYQKSFYRERNYNLFAMLADVRNGRGFAGIKTGEGFEPIAAPRGIPDDACPEYKKIADGYDVDGHSHSYFTVQELLAYDWTQVSTLQGIVGLVDLARWKISGEPQSWSGGIWGGNVKTFDAERGVAAVEAAIETLKPMHDRLSWYRLMHIHTGLGGNFKTEGLEPDQLALLEAVRSELDCSEPHFVVNWTIPYFEAAGSFLQKTMPRLWRLGDPADVRICFFFDN